MKKLDNWLQIEEREIRFLLPINNQLIEVELAKPKSFELKPRMAVICHPHPLHDGTMDNKVVYTLRRAFLEQGIATLRFNFRGVGQSSGQFDDGKGEATDLNEILKWVKAGFQQLSYDNVDLFLAGFSFGSYVVALMLDQLNSQSNGSDFLIKKTILVAPAVTREYATDFPVLNGEKWNVTIIQGESDEVVDPEAVYRYAQLIYPDSASNNKRLIRVSDSTHFFHHQLTTLKMILKTVIEK